MSPFGELMDNSQNLAGYIRLMKDILQRKRNALGNIIELTEAQAGLLVPQEFDDEAFDELIDRKEKEIARINELDDGFTAVFNKIKSAIQNKGDEHAAAIKELQALITEVTEMGVKITALEKKNKDAMENRRNEIKRGVKNFNVSRNTASSYYRNMSGVGGEAGPVFMDQKK